MKEKVGVDSAPAEYVVDIRAFAVELLGEPLYVVRLWLLIENFFDTLTDMNHLAGLTVISCPDDRDEVTNAGSVGRFSVYLITGIAKRPPRNKQSIPHA